MTTSLPVDAVIFFSAALLLVGILVVGMSDRLRVPASLLSLAVGMLFGSDVLGIVDLDDPELVRNISVVALVVILFEGGLTTKPTSLRAAGPVGLTLSTLGVLITGGVTALGVEVVFGLGWTTSLLLGAVVASTDAAVVFELVRRAPLPRRVADILEVESGANDPFAIMLTVGLLAVFDDRPIGVGDWVKFGIWQLVGGVLVGLVVGWLSRRLLRMRLRSEGLYPIVAAALAGLSYGSASTLGASGFLAVYVTGLIIGATVPRRRRSIRSFHSSLANGADIGLFLLLGLLVFPSQLPGVAVPALVVTAILVFLARPLAVAVSVIPFRMQWKDQVILSWAGLRGAVPIVLATFPATAGVPDGQTIFNVVFFVVLTSTLLQGTTTVSLVRKLGLAAPVPAWRSVAEALPLDVPDIDLAELEVTPDLSIANLTIRERPPGPGLLIVAILREGETVLPAGDSVMLPGDLVVLSVDHRRAGISDITAWARGEGL